MINKIHLIDQKEYEIEHSLARSEKHYFIYQKTHSMEKC